MSDHKCCCRSHCRCSQRHRYWRCHCSASGMADSHRQMLVFVNHLPSPFASQGSALVPQDSNRCYQPSSASISGRVVVWLALQLCGCHRMRRQRPDRTETGGGLPRCSSAAGLAPAVSAEHNGIRRYDAVSMLMRLLEEALLGGRWRVGCITVSNRTFGVCSAGAVCNAAIDRRYSGLQQVEAKAFMKRWSFSSNSYSNTSSSTSNDHDCR